MSKELDTTGRAAQVHLKELQLCQDKTKGYHARRIEATERLRPMLKKIWTALEDGETVNSHNTKEMWAKWFNPGAKGTNAMRQIQRIIADPREKKATSRRPSMALLKELITFISEQPRNKKDPDSLIEIRGKAMEVGDSIDWLPPVWKKELDEERAADRKEEEVIAQHEAEKSAPRLTMHTRYHKSQGDQILCGKYTGTTLSTPNDEEVNCPVCLKLMHPEKKSPAKNSRKTKLFSSVDITALDKHRDEQERKGYMKKFRAAKRAAKFFSGMYLEFANGVDGRYDRFLELYPPNGDDRKYPWTPPQKGYNLPQTEKRFLAQSDAASEEFNKLLDEGIGKGWMTTEPRKKTTVTEEPLSEPAKALAAAEKANKRSKGTNATPAATAATTGLVKMVRIGNTDEFGVFPESCWKYTTANALRIGTRQECEAERDRINAKHIANNNSVENLVAHGDAHQNQQQHPAAGALEKALDSTESVEVSDQQHDEQQCDYSEEQVAAMLAQGSELPEL